jgi:hypothetical protein
MPSFFAGGSAYGLEATEGVRGELLATGRRDASRFNIANVLGAIIYDFPYRTNSVYAVKELARLSALLDRAAFLSDPKVPDAPRV